MDMAMAQQPGYYSAVRPGPFVSGTTHRVLQLGQRPVVGNDSDGEAEAGATGGRAGASGAGPGETSAARRGKASSGGGGSAGASLADLLAAGILKPGRNKIAVAHRGERVAATLTKEGQIIWQGKKYTTPTAFTVAVKRQTAPAGRQGNDGWRAALYEGAPLEKYRRQYAAQFLPALDDLDEEELLAELAGGGPSAAAAAAGEDETAAAEAAAVPATDQWVQCDRCDTWRVVPDAAWPALAAAESESWSCADATWNLNLMPPHTPACV